MQAMADSAAFWVALGLATLAAYLLPTWIALGRRVDGVLLVFLVNLIGGTALIGWPAAMILAGTLPPRYGPRQRPAEPLPPWPTAPPQWPSPPPADPPRNVLVMSADPRDPDSFSPEVNRR
jgi:hypothetical protein